MRIVKPMSRSVYKVRYPVKGSFNLGEICPIGAPIEVTPADGFKLDICSVIRMATPIAPIMDDLDAEIAAFFVPTRLVSNKALGDMTAPYAQGTNYSGATPFEKIIGNGVGNPADWQQTNLEAFSAPTENWKPSQARTANYTTIGEAMGLGLGIGGTQTKEVLAYQLYGYNLIYQEHFRNENVETSRTLNYTSNINGVSGSNTSTSDDSSINTNPYNQALSVAYKHGDMFTNAVPNPQKGPSVPLPLGTEANLKTGTAYNLGGTMTLGNSATGINPGNKIQLALEGPASGYDNKVQLIADAAGPSGSYSDINRTNLKVDLSNATAATVNSFIEAYNIQQLLMNDIKGTRYYEQLIAHFGVQNEDIKLYRPEILSVNRFAINVSTVVQQSGAAAGAGSETDQNNYLGTTGGYSMTAHKDHAVSQDFGEFGYIYLIICIRQKHTYGQGIPKQYLRSTRFDWFFPELGRIGWQAIDKRRLNAEESGTVPFGYEPAWQELRDVNHGQVFGFLNPTKANALEYWTLAEEFPSTPTLSISFLKENRSNLARALTIGDTGPDFIMDALIVGTKSTLVPVSNTPKLFD